MRGDDDEVGFSLASGFADFIERRAGAEQRALAHFRRDEAAGAGIETGLDFFGGRIGGGEDRGKSAEPCGAAGHRTDVQQRDLRVELPRERHGVTHRLFGGRGEIDGNEDAPDAEDARRC